MAVDPSLVVAPGASLREVLETVTKNSRQVAAVVQDGRLVGLVTDGDIRRAILRGFPLHGSIADAMNPAPRVAAPDVTREAALALMHRHVIRHLPVVDAEQRLVGLLLLDELMEAPPLPNHAVVMAGGAGRRLQPLTETVPKPLVRVGGQPLLEILIGRLRQAGVRDFHVTVHHKSEMIERHFGDGRRLDVRIDYVREPRPLGTAGSLRLLAPAPEHPFFLVNGDILTKCDFRTLLAFHVDQGADMTVGTVPHVIELPYGTVEATGEQLTAIAEKPRLDFRINSGIYVVAPEAIRLIPPTGVFDATDLIRALLDAGRRVAAYPIREYWLDVGRHDDFSKADRDVAEGLLE